MKEIQRILEQRNIGFRDEVVANCVRELVRGTEPVGRFTLDVDTKKECYQDGEGFQFPVYRITVKLIEEGEKLMKRKTSRLRAILTFVIMFVVVAIGGLLFTGCAYRDNTFQDSGRFKLIDELGKNSDGYFILVDKETRVMYLFVKYGYGAGLEVMVDEEGKPMLYEGEL